MKHIQIKLMVTIAVVMMALALAFSPMTAQTAYAETTPPASTQGQIGGDL